MIRWHDWALSALETNSTVAMILLTDVSGSAPRDAGTRMFVSADAQWGTIGGGNLEYSAVETARSYLSTGCAGTCQIDDYALGPELAQCCGGYVRVLTMLLSNADVHWLNALKNHTDQHQNVTIETSIVSENDVKVFVSVITDAKDCQPSVQSSIEGAGHPHLEQKFVEVLPTRLATVSMFGAGHVGQAVAHALTPLPLYIRWYEGRPDYFQISDSPNLESINTMDPQIDVADAPSNSLFLIFTHSHELDFQIAKAVLGRGDFNFCGLIGSRTKRASFERRLREEGISEDQINRLVCPIGLPSLKSKDPSVIAAGVAAQIMSRVEAEQGDHRGR